MLIYEVMDERKRESLKLNCECAQIFASRGDLESAVFAYMGQWRSIPDPKTKYEATTVVLTSVGDVCFSLGFNHWARTAFTFAAKCPGAANDPFLHMRLGQVLLDLGDDSNALVELALALKEGGESIFEAPQDQKYLFFLQSSLSE